MSRSKAVNTLSYLLLVAMGEGRADENGIHANTKENGVASDGSSTSNALDGVRGQESERSESGVVKGEQGLEDSF